MSWHRSYDHYLLFSRLAEPDVPWRLDAWEARYEPLMRQLLAPVAGFAETAVRVLSYEPKDDSGRWKTRKHGRLGWNAKSHRSWALADDDSATRFGHFEAWAPSWNACEKTDTAPDGYLAFSSERTLRGDGSALQFDMLCTVAIAVDLDLDPMEAVLRLSRQLGVTKTVRCRRPWARGPRDPSGNWHLPNSIQDTHSADLYRTDDHDSLHDVPLQDLAFQPYWQVLD